MDQQQSITVFSIPSGLGGAHTVSIIEDLGEKVRVRIWYGRPTPSGWESWKDWDGKELTVPKSSLSRERTQKLVRPAEETDAGWMFCQPYEADCYSPEKIVAKYVCAFPEGELYRMFEVDAQSRTLKEYRVLPEDLTDDQIRRAQELKGMAFNQVKVWEREQAPAL
ncbi:hypothetical protein [Marinobacter shengliensis]|uniref:hypothetical protein n=1 Tax=Marinobacter shengliensis TaxID=1389223 RepID=UPI001109E89D|nr:hypothetical protein [Marinobacter shengliensis]